MLRHLLDGARIKQVGVVFKVSVQTILTPDHRQCQVILGAGLVVFNGRESQFRQIQYIHRRILQNECDLKERRMAHVANRLQGFHQLLERQILVIECSQGGLAHLAQQLAKSKALTKVGSED